MKRVTFTKEQIEALSQQFCSCLKCAQVNNEFNAYSFYGAVETTLENLVKDCYIYLEEEDC